QPRLNALIGYPGRLLSGVFRPGGPGVNSQRDVQLSCSAASSVRCPAGAPHASPGNALGIGRTREAPSPERAKQRPASFHRPVASTRGEAMYVEVKPTDSGPLSR